MQKLSNLYSLLYKKYEFKEHIDSLMSLILNIREGNSSPVFLRVLENIQKDLEQKLLKIQDENDDLYVQLKHSILTLEEVSGLILTESEVSTVIIDQLDSALVFLSNFFESIDSKIKNLSQIQSREIKIFCMNQSSPVLYRAVGSEHIESILSRGSILGYTSHRFWDEGKRYSDQHPKYNDSYWMKGISMSRDLEYAMNWSSVVLIFDKEKISHHHKVEPYAWNYHMSNGKPRNFKKEREDFVVLSKKKKQFKKRDNPEMVKAISENYDEIINIEDFSIFDDPEGMKTYHEKCKIDKENDLLTTDIDSLKAPEGEFDFSQNDALIGIILWGGVLEYKGLDDASIQSVVQHPKFLGFFNKNK